MREILFRGKLIEKYQNTEAWNYGSLLITADKAYHIFVLPSLTFDVDAVTVSQYTGLKDRDGERIFEGDIVKIDNGADEETIIGFVVYEYASWQIDCGPDFISLWRHLDELKEYQSVGIIGNIHDAPELLELKKKE